MQFASIAFASMLLAGSAQAQVAVNCAAVIAPQALEIRPTVIAPVAPELLVPSHQLGSPAGVLAQAFDESLSVDQVLYRIRLAGCTNVASVTPVAAPGALPAAASASALPLAPGAAAMPAAIDPAAYKPRSEFDNAPWRFDMNQNGKRMTADDFTAWMEAKGVRVVPRPPVVVAVSVDGQDPVIPVVAPAPATPSDDGSKPKP